MKHVFCLPNSKAIKLLFMSTHLEQKKKDEYKSNELKTKIPNKYSKLTE